MGNKSISVRFNEEMYGNIQDYAEQNGITQSEIIKEAVKEFISKDYLDKEEIVRQAVSMAREVNSLMVRYPDCNFRGLQERGNRICQLLSIW